MATNTPKLGLVNPELGKGEKYDLDMWTENNNKIDANATAVSEQLAEKANKAQEAWITPTLINGWVAQNSVGYYKDSVGRVHLRGRVLGGISYNSIFTLPPGYRPQQSTSATFVVYDVNVYKSGFLGITTEGLVFVYTSSPLTGYLSLDGINFKAV